MTYLTAPQFVHSSFLYPGCDIKFICPWRCGINCWNCHPTLAKCVLASSYLPLLLSFSLGRSWTLSVLSLDSDVGKHERERDVVYPSLVQTLMSSWNSSLPLVMLYVYVSVSLPPGGHTCKHQNLRSGQRLLYTCAFFYSHSHAHKLRFSFSLSTLGVTFGKIYPSC